MPDQTGKTKPPSTLFDPSIARNPQVALDFMTGILEASTEYSIIGKDLDGTIVLWNEGARRIYGYEPSEMVGKANSTILHTPEDREAGLPQRIMQTALREGRWEGEIDRVRQDGERFTARVVATPRHDGRGYPAGLLLISKDVSDEVRLAGEREAGFYASSLMEAALDPFIAVNPDDSIANVNAAAEKVTGLTRTQLIGTSFSNYFTEPDKAAQCCRKALSEGFVRDLALAARHTDGGYYRHSLQCLCLPRW